MTTLTIASIMLGLLVVLLVCGVWISIALSAVFPAGTRRGMTSTRATRP